MSWSARVLKGIFLCIVRSYLQSHPNLCNDTVDKDLRKLPKMSNLKVKSNCRSPDRFLIKQNQLNYPADHGNKACFFHASDTGYNQVRREDLGEEAHRPVKVG